MAFTVGSTVARFLEPPPNRATILTIRGTLVRLAYEEGGEGWWDIGALEEVPDPLAPNFQMFLDTIIASPLYQKVLMQSVASPEVNVAFTTVMGALILAATGRPNLPALQSGFDALLGAMTLEGGDIEALQSIAAGANLGAALNIAT